MKTNLVKLFIQATLLFVLTAAGIGAVNAADDFCWRDSYGRGIGTIPKGCTGDRQDENGLCYNKCPAGMQGVGPVCWSQCPGGYTDMGAVCHISEPLTRKPDWVCKKKAPKWLGGRCMESVARCPDGYASAGLFCALKSRPTPSGFSGTYLDPVKNTHPRGAGIIPTQCGNGQQMDAGLCYTACRPGYQGAGPVCWGAPPVSAGKKWVTCGMGSAKDQVACASVVFDQVSSVGNMALNVATFGASVEAEKAANGAVEAEKLSQLKSTYAAMKNTVKASKSKALEDLEGANKAAKAAGVTEKEMNRFHSLNSREGWESLAKVSSIAKSCGAAGFSTAQAASSGQALAAEGASLDITTCMFNAGSKMEKQLTSAQVKLMVNASRASATAALMANSEQQMPPDSKETEFTPADYARIAAQIAAILDPTGVASTVAAYTYPKCSELFH